MLEAASGRQATRSTSTTVPSVQQLQKTAKHGDQQATAMGPPDVPKTATSSRPQRQAKVDALAKKVWSALAPGAGRKRANSTNQSTSDVPIADIGVTDTQPVTKKRKEAVETQTTGRLIKSKPGQSGAVPVQSDVARRKPQLHPNLSVLNTPAARNVKAIPRVQVSVDSDSASESGEDVPLAQAQAAMTVTANPSRASTMSKNEAPSAQDKPEDSESEKRLTRSRRTTAQGKARAPLEVTESEVADEGEDAFVESDAYNSADSYAPEDKDDESSEEDELNDPLSEDLEELEAQLRAEAPEWTKEKDDKLPLVLRRKQTKKAVELKFEEEQEPCAGTSQRSTSKASLRRQIEQPVWKTTEPERNSDAEDDSWGPVVYTIPEFESEDGNIGGSLAADESDAHSNDGHADSDFHPQVYEIKPPLTPGGVLSLKEQNEHIQDMIRYTFTRVESNLVFTNRFPDAVGRARFVYEAMRESAQELGYGGLYHRLGKDASFARILASLPNQRISTFRSNVKKHTDSAVIAFYGLQPGQAADKVEWLFDHLKYIYPLVHEPADRRNATWTKPYQNSAVASTLRACFFTGMTAVGNRDEERFVSSRPDRADEREIPMPMLALVGAALHASLSEWRAGVHKKGTFSADTFLDAYTEHVTLLTGIKSQNPRAYHTTMHRLYTEASGTMPPTANAANATNALAYVDFAGMDVD